MTLDKELNAKRILVALNKIPTIETRPNLTEKDAIELTKYMNKEFNINGEIIACYDASDSTSNLLNNQYKIIFRRQNNGR